jgi:uncharacterized protein (DUF1499 family)
MTDDDSNQILLECPNTPNCVSSEATNPRNYVEPIAITGEADRMWKTLVDLLRTIARCDIVEQRDNYIHAEVKSRIFRFVDDLEFYLQTNKSCIAVRSSSRVGSYDFGVNRRRVEMIRKSLDR